MNVFRFLNVGQGLFYSGRIGTAGIYNYWHYKKFFNESDFRFVYDCGSESSNGKQYISRAIQNDFFVGERVDIVFLSHLHEDHINGLLELNRYVEIKKIVPPYIANFTEPFLFGYLGSLSDFDNDNINSFTEKFFSNKSLFLEHNKKDIEGVEEEDWIKKEISKNNEFSTKKIIYSNYRENKNWVFFLVNKAISTKTIDAIKKDMCMLLGKVDTFSIDDITCFIKMSPKNIDKIKEIYVKHLGKKLNISSTVVIHHPEDELDKATMLTGDAEFDEDMIRICSDYLKDNDICYLQVPHHGSKNNWFMMKPLCDTALNLYVSFGLGNKYHHPNQDTLNDIFSLGRPLYCSTQSLYYLFPWNEYFIK